MKRIILFLISFCLVLCACSSPTETKPSEIVATTKPQVTTETTQPTNATETTVPASTNATIPETVVFDNGDFKLTATEIDFSDNYHVKVKFLAENNSDANVTFHGNQFSINGITMYCNFYIKVAAGKKANDFLEIDKDDLAAAGIRNIATIKAQDAYIYNKDISERITDFQFELQTSVSDGYVQEIDRSGQIVYDQDGIVVKYRGIVPGTFKGEALEFFVENNTDANITIHADNVSVNGFMIYGNMVAYAYGNCVTYATLDFSSSDMEESGITTIEEVSMNLYGYNQDTRKREWESEEFTVGRAAELTDATSNAHVGASGNANDLDAILDVIAPIIAYENLSIKYDGDSVIVEYWYDGLSEAVSLAKNWDQSKIDSWNKYVELEKNNCNTMKTILEEEGFFVTIVWNVIDDQNHDQLLLQIIDGEVVYNAVEQE